MNVDKYIKKDDFIKNTQNMANKMMAVADDVYYNPTEYGINTMIEKKAIAIGMIIASDIISNWIKDIEKS